MHINLISKVGIAIQLAISQITDVNISLHHLMASHMASHSIMAISLGLDIDIELAQYFSHVMAEG